MGKARRPRSEEQQLQKLREEVLPAIQEMCLWDDGYSQVYFSIPEGEKALERILQIVLEAPEFRVRSVSTQKGYKNLLAHSTRLDVEAVGSDGTLYDIEIQQQRETFEPKRIRFYIALIDSKRLNSGEGYDKLQPLCIIFFTREDFFGAGEPLYHIDQTVRETRRPYIDGTRIIFVNGAYTGDDVFGQLVRDFQATDPSKMVLPELAAAANIIKNTEGGQNLMCEAFEKVHADGVQVGLRQGEKAGRKAGRKAGQAEERKTLIRNLLKKVSPQEAAELAQIPLEEVLKYAR